MKDFLYKNTKVSIHSEYPDDHIYNIIKRGGAFYEIKLLNAIANLKLDGVYVDVGANIGNHTVFFALFTNSKLVVSIEIHPEIYENLLQNINLNPSNKYYPINVGVGDEDKRVSLSDIDTKNVGMTHIDSGYGSVEVRMLDDLLSGSGKISLIKIDVEGYELKAIKGALGIIEKYKPVLVVECRTDDDFAKINGYLEGIGYRTDKINYTATPTYIWMNKN